ncbi:unnamed protein product [Parnassius apollo]|uniref:(apollo) hypothetical protein n=1 Tax=Parnassius apollo TaxID=110799 RepID=A0A8S3WNK7_PARAO|nr:unnamed protein product [Parnassius apollo]
MVTDLNLNTFSLRDVTGTYFPLVFENDDKSLACSSIALRGNEGTMLNDSEREIISSMLIENKDMFTPGGEATTFELHRINTGDNAPIAVPPYRLTPAKKEIVRAELDKMLEQKIIEEAESEWTSPVVCPRKMKKHDFVIQRHR